MRLKGQKMTVESQSNPRFTHGGARPGAGRKRGVPNRRPSALAKEIARLSDAVEKLRQQRRLETEHGERILARLVSIERQLGLVEKPMTPKPSRRHPMGA
jgi:hypothetical protein